MTHKQTTIVGNIELDPWRNEVTMLSHAKTVYLSPKEFRIFSVLAMNPKTFLTREEILKEVQMSNVTKRTVDAHICFIRRKMPWANIVNRAKLGYSFEG